MKWQRRFLQQPTFLLYKMFGSINEIEIQGWHFYLHFQIRCNRSLSLRGFCEVARDFLNNCTQQILATCFRPQDISAILQAQRESLKRRITEEIPAERNRPAECSLIIQVTALLKKEIRCGEDSKILHEIVG